MNDILIVGCGETGRRIAHRHLARGDAVTGLVRSADSAEALRSAGITPLSADLDAEPPAWPTAARVYWLAPPPAEGESDTRLARALATLPPPAAFLYMSTTGVYGERGGEWVDESTPAAPDSPRSRRRFDAERRARFWALQHGVRIAVVRAAAIWCGARLPLERLRAGTRALAAEASSPVNRIHAEDLAALCVAALDREKDEAIYDAADGEPCSTAEYLLAVAECFGLPPPELLSRAEAASSLAAEAWLRQEGAKRVRAQRIRSELGIQPRTLAAGLAAFRRDGRD